MLRENRGERKCGKERSKKENLTGMGRKGRGYRGNWVTVLATGKGTGRGEVMRRVKMDMGEGKMERKKKTRNDRKMKVARKIFI